MLLRVIVKGMVDYVGVGARRRGLGDDIIRKLVIVVRVEHIDDYSRRNAIFLEQEDDQQQHGSSA